MGKNRTWHREWVVDLINFTATHSSGLIVMVESAVDGQGVIKTPNVDEWNKLQLLKMNSSDLIKHTQKLCQEGKKAYDYTKNKRDH